MRFATSRKAMEHWSDALRRRMSRLSIRPEREGEIVDELSQHLQDRYEELRAGGASDETARFAVLAELDSRDLVAAIADLEERAVEPVPLGGGSADRLAAGLLQDLHFGARLLAKDWSAALVIVVTLGLAIAANAIVFGFTDLLLLRPLPLGHATRLVTMYSVDRRETQNRQRLSMPDLLDIGAQNRSFEDVGAMTGRQMSLTGSGEPLAVFATSATPNLHRLLDIPAVAGRALVPDDAGPERERVAVLSHKFWAAHFSSSPSILGRTIMLNGLSCTVVGVLTPAIELGNLATIDVWLPLELSATAPREDRSLTAFGLLRPGVTAAAASAELTAIGERIEREHPVTNSGRRIFGLSLRDSTVGSSAWIILSLLGLVVGLVLVVACANVATVMLARASARRREIAMRVALGATRGRLVRQLVSEGLLLGFTSGVIGLILTYAGLAAFKASTAETFFQRLEINGNVIAFAVALSLAAPILFGILPALQSSRPDLHEDLKDGGRDGGASARGNRIRSALIVAQIALAFAVLIVAGLDVRTVRAIVHRPLGFAPEGLLTTRVRFDPPKYADDAARFRTVQAMVDRLRAVPGVTAAAAASALPVVENDPVQRFVIPGRPAPRPTEIPWAIETSIEGDYARTLGVRAIEGRMVTPDDAATQWTVAVVNREAVRRYWAGRSPIGSQLAPVDAAGRPAGEPLRIVGVVDSIMGADLNELPPPRIYLPLATRPLETVAFLVRGTGAGVQLASGVRDALRAADRDLAVAEVRRFSEAVDAALREYYLILAMFISFAGIGLVVAVSGVYGVTAFSVGQRRHEIGVRLALGATGRDILGLIVGRSVRLLGVGVVFGAVVAWMIGVAMRSQLVGVGAGDPLTFATVFTVLMLGGLLATYVPAYRAMSIAPASVLKRD
jgi:putative ABC transport system permease protein